MIEACCFNGERDVCGGGTEADSCHEAPKPEPQKPGGPHGPCRTVTLTPAGWAASKYGRDPRTDSR